MKTTSSSSLPPTRIETIIEPVTRFLQVEASGGIVLGLATVIALVLANSSISSGYVSFWKTEVGFSIGSWEMSHSLQHWISDGLMAIFFFVVGLEIKREIARGELHDVRRAFLPVMAAFGGMVFPAGIYLLLQIGEPGARGWGIPMATDIAFVVGCIAALGPRVPRILRVMLLSLAIVDDIGAILVIAVGYTDDLNLIALLLAFVGLGAVFFLRQLGVRSLLVYGVFGVLVWLGFHESGIHATIAGVILGLMTPSRSEVSRGLVSDVLRGTSDVIQDDWESLTHRGKRVKKIQKAARATIPPMEYLEDTLHPWSSFFIMPVFALANAGVPLKISGFADPVATAVIAGLVIGKPVGIFLFSWLAVKFFLKKLPEGLTWSTIFGGGCLGGIGFTMALFIAGLALPEGLLGAAKMGILGGSLVAALLGIVVLFFTLPKGNAAK